ncbi:sodium:solute symporter family protein [Maribellus maritimus]|uniref:sodium:solute symporter family protein n=1 Tax=Maribellus maritimus TaxID=2870838 RepID=UPI001EECA149|nr:sodium:solute symporter family protein [Maribellus maritimus]MCG6190482.1 Na+:solute symporter [Maribellus maritimus]
MHFIDYIVIVIFFIGILVAGLSFSGSGKNMINYFAAGGAVPWWISGLSLFMSFFSAGTFVVWGSIAYTNGLVAITIQWTMAIAGFIIGVFIAPRWHKAKVLTAAEYITQRLGIKVQKLYSYLFLFVSLFTTGAFLYPVAKIVEVSTGFPLHWCIIILGLIIILYTTAGGLWAVIVTDVLQFIILTTAVLVIVPLAFQRVDGITAFIQHSPNGFFDFFSGEYTLGFIIAFGLYNLFFISGNWAYVQRYTSVSTKKDAKKVGYLFGSLYLISPVIWMLPPMIYRVLNPGLTGFGDEGAYLMMCKEVLPIGMLGLILGAMIFATSSSVNTTLNISAGVFTNDLYKNIKPNVSNKHLMIVARFATIGFGLLTIVVALLVQNMGGIVEVVLSVAAITGGALYLPPLWSLFSKRQTGKSILTATLTSLLISVIFKFATPYLFDFTLTRTQEMTLGVIAPVLVLIFFEVKYHFTQKENPDFEKYKRIKEKQLLESHQQTSSNSQNRHGKNVISFGVAGTGILIVGIGAFAATGRWLVLIAGTLIIITGLIMIPKNKKTKK